MDDDSDTEFSIFNNGFNESCSVKFKDFLLSTHAGKSAFARFIVCTVFAVLTIIGAFVPGLPYTLEFSLKAVFCFCAMVTGYSVYGRGLKRLFELKFATETMAAICTVISYLFGILTGLHWFESGRVFNNDFCFIIIPVVLAEVLFGDFVKSGLKCKSTDAVERLCEFVPESVGVFRNEESEIVDFKDIRRGDCARVLPGEMIPFDAVVTEGETTVDESALTGGNGPVKKEPGNRVFAGSINKYGEIVIKSTCSGEECLVCRLIRMAKRELDIEFDRQGMTERAVSRYMPFVFALSIAFAIFLFISGASAEDAFAIAAMVIALACPAAIAFAEPIMVLMIISKAYKENIIIQNPNVVSVLNSTDVFAFDKSGTLTVGEHIITDVYTFGGHTEKQVLEYAVSIESVTDHPLSDAIFEYAFSQGISEKKVDDLKTLGGEGVRAVIDGKEVLLGDYTIFDMPTECEAVYKKLLDEEKTVAFMVIDSVPAALIAAADSYKEGALELLAALKKSGIKTHLLADDVLEGTDTLACEIYEDGDVSESFPDVKALRIKSIKSAGNSVAMVGDGINDTVALIIADVAISVGTATAAALEASDIIIKSDNLSDIMKVINLSKLYTSISQQNIVLSTVFNLLLIPFVLLTGVRGMLHLSESVLIVAVLSVFAVIINTLRVKNKGM